MKKLFIILLFLIAILAAPTTVHAADDFDFKELFDNHQSIMLIIHPITGEIYYANPIAAEFYGYTLEILVEMNINDINTLTPDEIAAERLRALNEERNFFIFKHRLANGDIKTVHVYSYPIEISGETYLFSIIVDQTDNIIQQNREKMLINIIIIFLIIGIVSSTLVIFFISKNRRRLKVSEQRYKILHDASFSGIAIHDKGIILECNQGLSDLTGYSLEELIGMDLITLVVQEYRDLVSNNIQSRYEKPYEVLGIKKNGEFFPLRLEAKNTTYMGREVRVAEFRDISELKKQEELKRSLEMQWSKLISSMPLGMNLREMICDEKGRYIDYRFVEMNDAYETMTGFKKADVIGKLATEVMPDIESYWIEKYAEVVLNKRTITIENYSRSLGKHFRVVAYPYKDNQFVIIAEDITERRLQEQKLINSENEKGRIIDSLPGVFYKCKFDDDWTMLYMSEYCETLTGYKAFEFIENYELSLSDLILPQYREHLMNRWLEARKNNQSINVEYEIIKKDGTKAWIWEKGKVFEQNGEWFIEGFLMDISDQKQNEQNILYASKHDFLTGLPNRRYFNEKIKELDKPENYPLLIAMVDMNGLKLINDAYGHQIGDQAIIQVANLLTECCTEPAFISRIGGDEFLIISPLTTVAEFKEKRNKLLTKISQIKIKEISLSLSFGATIKTDQSVGIDDTITDAENNMYANKVIHSQSSRNQTINAIFESLKEKYDEERIHSDRVSQFCALMGEKLQLSQNDQLELRLAGRMHDIGKITIPDHILKKPGKLTDEEWTIMKSHTTNGYQILRSADQYSRLADYALTHHERYDGKGYPQGLKGEDIPLYSRIIAICDAYEAMTADRPYRKALTKEVAIAELKRCAGTQFDPRLVEVFVNEVVSNEVL